MTGVHTDGTMTSSGDDRDMGGNAHYFYTYYFEYTFYASITIYYHRGLSDTTESHTSGTGSGALRADLLGLSDPILRKSIGEGSPSISTQQQEGKGGELSSFTRQKARLRIARNKGKMRRIVRLCLRAIDIYQRMFSTISFLYASHCTVGTGQNG